MAGGVGGGGGFLQSLKGKFTEVFKEVAAGPPDAFERRLTDHVERATSELLTGPDWGLNFELVDTINNDPTCAQSAARSAAQRPAQRSAPLSARRPGASRRALLRRRRRGASDKVYRALRRVLLRPSIHSQLLALTLLEACVKNCVPFFFQQLIYSELWAEIMRAGEPLRNWDPEVRDRALGLVEDFARGLPLPAYNEAYESLLDRGVDFPVRPAAPADEAAAVPYYTPPPAPPAEVAAAQGISPEDRAAIAAAVADLEAQEAAAAARDAALAPPGLPAAGHVPAVMGPAVLFGGAIRPPGYVPPPGYHPPHAAAPPPMVAGAGAVPAPGGAPAPGAAGGGAPVPSSREDVETTLRVSRNSAELLAEMLAPIKAGGDAGGLQESFVADLVDQCLRYKALLAELIPRLGDEHQVSAALRGAAAAAAAGAAASSSSAGGAAPAAAASSSGAGGGAATFTLLDEEEEEGEDGALQTRRGAAAVPKDDLISFDAAPAAARSGGGGGGEDALRALALLVLLAALASRAGAGPTDRTAAERGLTDPKKLTSKLLLAEGDDYFRGTANRNFKGPVLGFVTPWHGHGYEVAERWRAKFTHISPVWYQLRPTTDKGGDDDGIRLTGAHDVDQAWIARLRAPVTREADCHGDAGSQTCGADFDAVGAARRGGAGPPLDAGGCAPRAHCAAAAAAAAAGAWQAPPLIVPRVISELPTAQLVRMLEEPESVIDMLLEEVEKQGFDGLAFEVWLQLAGSGGFALTQVVQASLELVAKLGAALKAKGKVLVLPAPPPVFDGAEPRLTSSAVHLCALAAAGVSINIMTYDHAGADAGPNAPLPWVEANARALLDPAPAKLRAPSDPTRGLGADGGGDAAEDEAAETVTPTPGARRAPRGRRRPAPLAGWEAPGPRAARTRAHGARDAHPRRAVPAGQLFIGLPFYGWSWRKPDAGGAAPTRGAVKWPDFQAALRTHNAALRWDAAAAEHKIKFKGGGWRTTMYYPTPPMLEARLQLAARLGVGVAVWDLGQGADAFLDLL
ncbi:chid1 [Scenedesmus sp. PABB004]|nr:chid1 [Scenedesmus sp. PABB004]